MSIESPIASLCETHLLASPALHCMASPPTISVSPPTMTPERGRSRTRYPSHLSRELDAQGNPRPLMHRRGTSRTYETLEDLLTAAGYKETRIFTPEIERHETAEDKEDHERSAGLRGAVAKLFSAWMSSSDSHSDEEPHHSKGDDIQTKVPPSPLANRSTNTSSLRVRSPARSARQAVSRGSTSSLARSGAGSSNAAHLHVPPISRAHYALRHVASAPHFDKRGRRQSRQSRPSKQAPPPLPAKWLESLSAALRIPPELPLPSPPAAQFPRRPTILTRTQRARTTVTITNVECRSAPSSRSSSRVRPARVPSLAQTTVCDEGHPLPLHSAHYLPSPVPAHTVADDDEVEELDLSMMLIPAKRQNSIRSLRSVLVQHEYVPSTAARDEYARMMRRRLEEVRNEAETAEEDDQWDSGELITARVRRRSQLPRNWGWSS